MDIVKSDKWANLVPEDGKMGGDTNRSAESYARMGAAQAGKKHNTWQLTLEQKEANSARQLGKKKKKWTLEQKAAHSARKTGKKRGPYKKWTLEQKAAHSARMKGKKLGPQSAEHIIYLNERI